MMQIEAFRIVIEIIAAIVLLVEFNKYNKVILVCKQHSLSCKKAETLLVTTLTLSLLLILFIILSVI